MNRKITTTGLAAGSLAIALMLGGCTLTDEGHSDEGHEGHSLAVTTSAEAHDHHAMEHPMDGGPAPEGIADATDPRFAVGRQVRLTTDHMPGMDGAKATIAGAYKTYTYSVNYTPTDGSTEVKDHRWVVQEELADAGHVRLKDGTPVTIEADHMEGMKGAKGTVAYSTDETVYIVDYEADGMTMKNHKWVTESEIQALS